MMTLPLATPELPGTGGRLGPAPEDFQVTELPRYPPSGQGAHCFLRIRKRGLTSWAAAQRVARALDRRPGDVGLAGNKDRWAVTEQWISIPQVAPADALSLDLPDLEVLEAVCHGHKLRTGHLSGNRFWVRLQDVEDGAADRAEVVLAGLRHRGVYHYFGPQRFGRQGDNAEQGRALLSGRLQVRDRRKRRLLVSALQSALFHDYLVARLAVGPLLTPLFGELVQKTDTGGLFAAEDLDEVAARLATGALVPTGPIFGTRTRRPPAGSPAADLEDRVLADAGLARGDFAPLRRLAPGARRPLMVRPSATRVEPDGRSLWVGFDLPPGAYATVVLREVTKTPFADLRADPLATDAPMT